MKKDVSIILVSYNTCELTRNCLKSIYTNTKDINFDVWVVDNNSKDESCKMIKDEFPQVHLIETKDNLGFGQGNNKAIEQSNSKYCFLLNTDTILIDNPVKTLFDFMESDSNIGACGGNLYTGEMKHTSTYGHIPNLTTKILKTFQLLWMSKEHTFKIKDKGNNDNDELKQVGYITGADLMLRKEAIDKTGAFDKDFFMYFEETELQYRIGQAGYKVFVNPNAKIIHLEGKSSKNRVKRREAFLKSEYLFYKKCYGISKFSPIKAIFMASHLLRLFVQPAMILRVWKFILEN